MDHGLESPERRAAAGKPAQGSLTLSAFHQGGNIVIAIADDGGGLNTDRIREKAIAQELISASDDLTPAECAAIANAAYASGAFPPAVTPLIQTGPGDWRLDLSLGPSLAFKDVAMQLIAPLYAHALAVRDGCRAVEAQPIKAEPVQQGLEYVQRARPAREQECAMAPRNEIGEHPGEVRGLSAVEDGGEGQAATRQQGCTRRARWSDDGCGGRQRRRHAGNSRVGRKFRRQEPRRHVI
jgi:hypothetical protein